MEVIRCSDAHARQWNQFVESCSGATFYHRWEWKALNETEFRHETAYLAAMDGGRMLGVFPIVSVRSRLFGNLACSMPFVNYGGPVAVTEDVVHALIHAARAVVAEWGSDYLEIRSDRKLSADIPSSEHKISLTIALQNDPEAVLAGMKRDHRAEIRRAAKRGYTARFGPELIGDFYQVLSESWREMGTPIYRRRYLERVLSTFPDHSRLCVVYDAAGSPAAGALDGLHNGVVEGMWLGINRDHRRNLVGYVLYWELIQDACRRGFGTYHLGRSTKDSGSEQFKQKWNAGVTQLYWHYVAGRRDTIPDLSPRNPKFRMAIAAWRRLPLSVTQMLGPRIAAYIP